MPISTQQVFIVNGTFTDYFGNPINLYNFAGSTGPAGTNGIDGITGPTGPTGSTAAASKFIKEWITAGSERLTVFANEISMRNPGILIDEVESKMSDLQIQLWRINSSFNPNELSESTMESTGVTWWELVDPTTYKVNINGTTGDILIDLTYRLVNSTLTRVVIIC